MAATRLQELLVDFGKEGSALLSKFLLPGDHFGVALQGLVDVGLQGGGNLLLVGLVSDECLHTGLQVVARRRQRLQFGL